MQALRILLLLLIHQVITFTSQCSNTIHIQDLGDSKYLVDDIVYYVDSTNNMHYANVVNQHFHPITTPVINFGFSKYSYWFHYVIKNNTSHNKTLFHEIKNHYLEYIDYYISSDDLESYQVISSGSKRGKVDPIQIRINAGETQHIYFRVKSQTPLRIPIIIQTVEGLTKNKSKHYAFLGIFYGVSLFILFFALFIYIKLKEKIYLYFMLIIASLLVFSLGFDNLVPNVVWFNQPDYFWLRFTTFIPLIAFFYILFSEAFFLLEHTPRYIKYILKILKIIAIIIFIIFNIHYYTGNKLGFIFTPLTGIILIFISLHLWKNYNQKHLRFYIVANLFFVASLVLHIMSNTGIIQSFVLSIYALKTGYLLEIMVFSIAVADRYILFQRNFTQILQEKVEERTTELEQAMNNLRIRQGQLIQSEKMASLGTLVSGVAHEINNPLNFINGGISLYDDIKSRNKGIDEPEKAELETVFHMIREGFSRVYRVINALMTFSSGSASKMKEFSINETIQNTILLIKSTLPDNIYLKTRLIHDVRFVGSPEDFHIVFLHLIENAIASITAADTHEAQEILLTTDLHSNNVQSISIEIHNTGTHIEPENLGKVFDPFFTTREPGEGTGLGLTIVFNIVKKYGGQITISNTDTGVLASIRLPVNKS